MSMKLKVIASLLAILGAVFGFHQYEHHPYIAAIVCAGMFWFFGGIAAESILGKDSE